MPNATHARQKGHDGIVNRTLGAMVVEVGSGVRPP